MLIGGNQVGNSQGSSKIEHDIEEIYDYVESCKMQPLSATKVVVPKDELYDLLDALRRDVPVEIERYQKMLSQKSKIIENAESKANDILADAREQYRGMVEEHSIMQQAYQQAEIMVKQAEQDAQNMLEQANREAQNIIAAAQKQAAEIYDGAIFYTVDKLELAEKVIMAAYESTVNNSKALETALRGHIETIRRNRAELATANASADQSAGGANSSDNAQQDGQIQTKEK